MRIRDVATHASVSPATVSRVLNGDPRVGEEYRRRVLEAVDELGYRRNRLARNLRKQHTTAIGVVVSDIENPHFGGMVRAVENRAYEAGYRVLVCNTDESRDKQRDYLAALGDERVLGVIISPSDPDDAEISLLIDGGIAVVAFDREVADPRADAVIADNVPATREATEILLAAGRRRVAFIGGRADVETGAERRQGYREAMRAAGLPAVEADGGFRMDGGRAAVATLLEQRPRPDAIVVANNLMTAGALQALRDARCPVPDEIAVIGIDDPFWADLVDPPLTVMAQPLRVMADQAMALLLERVDGARQDPVRSVHPFELRRRGSCGTA
jgi:LacI family transcriptional regulator